MGRNILRDNRTDSHDRAFMHGNAIPYRAAGSAENAHTQSHNSGNDRA
jgi:hypothetical protein